MRTAIPIFFLSLLSTIVSAQNPQGEVFMLDMSSALVYVLLFYAVTLLTLGLLILKLVRPKFKSRWIYISAIIGIIGAGIVTTQFDQIQEEQLPKVGEEFKLDEERLSEETKNLLAQQRKEVVQQKFANFWIVAIPNIIMLGLCLVIDLREGKNDGTESTYRGRYD